MTTVGQAAAVLGVLAVAAGCAWPFAPQRQTMLLIQIAGTAALALHFILLGSPTAAITGGLSILHLLALAMVRHRGRLLAACAALLPIFACSVATTWHGTPSALATGGALLG